MSPVTTHRHAVGGLLQAGASAHTLTRSPETAGLPAALTKPEQVHIIATVLAPQRPTGYSLHPLT